LWCIACVWRQPHVDVVGLVVGCAPVAHGLPGHQGAQRGGDLRHRQAHVGRRFALDIDLDRGFVGLQAGVQIHHAGDAADLVHDQAAQAFQLTQVGALQGKLHLLVAAHRVEQANVGDGDAGHLLEPVPQHAGQLVHTAAARLAVHQPDINTGVHLALGIAGVDGGQGVPDLRKFAQYGFDLPGFGFGDLQRRTHWRVEIERRFRKISLGHKLGAEQRHHENAGDENRQRQPDGGQLVHQRPTQDALVSLGQRVGGALKPAGHAAYGLVVESHRCVVLAVRFNAWVVPDA